MAVLRRTALLEVQEVPSSIFHWNEGRWSMEMPGMFGDNHDVWCTNMFAGLVREEMKLRWCSSSWSLLQVQSSVFTGHLLRLEGMMEPARRFTNITSNLSKYATKGRSEACCTRKGWLSSLSRFTWSQLKEEEKGEVLARWLPFPGWRMSRQWLSHDWHQVVKCSRTLCQTTQTQPLSPPPSARSQCTTPLRIN